MYKLLLRRKTWIAAMLIALLVLKVLITKGVGSKTTVNSDSVDITRVRPKNKGGKH